MSRRKRLLIKRGRRRRRTHLGRMHERRRRRRNSDQDQDVFRCDLFHAADGDRFSFHTTGVVGSRWVRFLSAGPSRSILHPQRRRYLSYYKITTSIVEISIRVPMNYAAFDRSTEFFSRGLDIRGTAGNCGCKPMSRLFLSSLDRPKAA